MINSISTGNYTSNSSYPPAPYIPAPYTPEPMDVTILVAAAAAVLIGIAFWCKRQHRPPLTDQEFQELLIQFRIQYPVIEPSLASSIEVVSEVNIDLNPIEENKDSAPLHHTATRVQIAVSHSDALESPPSATNDNRNNENNIDSGPAHHFNRVTTLVVAMPCNG